MTRTSLGGIRAVALAAACVALPAAGAGQELTLVTHVKGPTGVTASSTHYLTPTRVRTSDGRFDTIVSSDADGARLVSIEHDKRQYWEAGVEEVNEMFAEMSRRFEGVPLAGLLGRDAAEIGVAPGDRTRHIAGHRCDHVVLTLGEAMRFDVWLAEDLSAPPAYFDALKLPYARLGPISGRFARLFDELKSLGRLPLATITTARMLIVTVENETEVAEVIEAPIPADAFAIPEQYQRRRPPFGEP